MSQPPPPPSFEAVLLHRSMTQRAVEDRFWSFDRALPPATTALILLWNWWAARRSEAEAQTAARRRNELALERSS